MQSIRKKLFLTAAALLIWYLAGCQQVFTYSPLGFLQRPLSSLSTAQQISFGEDALASGDPEQMAAALAALQGTNTVGAQYLASQLGVTLSNVPNVVLGVVQGTITVPTTIDATSISTFISQNNIDPSALIQAAANLQNAQELGQTLSPLDYAMGALGIALQGAQQPDGTLNFDPASVAAAQTFAQQGLAALPPDLPVTDPTYQLLSGLQTNLPGL
jgi:hypothetical protein